MSHIICVIVSARWTINELSTEMQMQASVLRRKITFWQNHGILHEEENDVFELIEDQKKNKDSVVMIEDEEESVTASSQDMKEEELQVAISFACFCYLVQYDEDTFY